MNVAYRPATLAAGLALALAGAAVAAGAPLDRRGQASVDIDFGEAAGLAYSPADLLVDPGTTAVFRGDFDVHPLAPQGAGNPIPAHTGPGTILVPDPDLPVPLPAAGAYQYLCTQHVAIGMRGVVRVGNTAPAAAVQVTTVSPALGSPVAFTAAASSDPDAIPGDAPQYAWDLDGDGAFERNTAGAPTVSTTFAAAGDHTVRVRVTDVVGASGEAALTVTIPGPASTTPPAPPPPGTNPPPPPPPATPPAARDRTPPVATGLGRTVAGTGAVTLRLRLTERATLVTGLLQRQRPGSRPARFVLVRRLSTRVLAKGRRALPFGRLVAGRYRLVATLRDAAGNRRVSTIGFTIPEA